MADNNKPDTSSGGTGGKADSWVKRHKVAIIGGGIAIALLIFIIIKRNSGTTAAQTGSTAALANAYPLTQAGIGAGYGTGFGSSVGDTGATGPAGPAGPPGPAGSPGSSGGSGGAGGVRTITVGGPHATKDLYALAKQYHESEAALLAENPFLKKYEGTKKPIPVKTKIKVPGK
jgi:hypothetical protein